jgi:hypothetical protein
MVWPLLFEVFLWRPISQWFYMKYCMNGIQMLWLDNALNAMSPFSAPIAILQWLDTFRWPWRGAFWLCAFAWQVLAATAAALMFWGTLRTFDLYMGRVRETSASDRRPIRLTRQSKPDDRLP